jgi:hypothetical protein
MYGDNYGHINEDMDNYEHMYGDNSIIGPCMGTMYYGHMYGKNKIVDTCTGQLRAHIWGTIITIIIIWAVQL